MNLLKPNPLGRDRSRELALFQRRLGYRFRHILLLQEALTHTSHVTQQRENHPPDNERLEFLGDAVLGLAIAEYLYQRYPTLQEGDLTKLRSRLVSRTALAEYARAVELDQLILRHEGSRRSNEPPLSTIAGATEALIGAIYLDGGLRAVQKFLFRNLRAEIHHLEAGLGEQDYKSLLQETALRKLRLSPRYHVIQETGPEHEKRFEVQVTIGSIMYGHGWGNSKRAAEQTCAAAALQQLADESDKVQRPNSS